MGSNYLLNIYSLRPLTFLKLIYKYLFIFMNHQIFSLLPYFQADAKIKKKNLRTDTCMYSVYTLIFIFFSNSRLLFSFGCTHIQYAHLLMLLIFFSYICKAYFHHVYRKSVRLLTYPTKQSGSQQQKKKKIANITKCISKCAAHVCI